MGSVSAASSANAAVIAPALIAISAPYSTAAARASHGPHAARYSAGKDAALRAPAARISTYAQAPVSAQAVSTPNHPATPNREKKQSTSLPDAKPAPTIAPSSASATPPLRIRSPPASLCAQAGKKKRAAATGSPP